jgi:uncharacterized protein YbjQ (UPF0145 family)
LTVIFLGYVEENSVLGAYCQPTYQSIQQQAFNLGANAIVGYRITTYVLDKNDHGTYRYGTAIFYTKD